MTLRCEHRRPILRALGYDGTNPHEVAEWITRASADPQIQTDLTPAGVVHVHEQIDGSTRETLLRLGDVAVQAPTSRFGWDAVPARSFQSSFTVLPRECPVYETNDNAE